MTPTTIASSQIVKQFKAARRVSTPVVAINTLDPAATQALLIESFNGDTPPLFRWDLVRALTGITKDAVKSLSTMIGSDDLVQATTNPAEALNVAGRMPPGSVLFFLNAHRFVEGEAVAQALQILRDEFQQDQRMVVLLSPKIRLPIELQNDVVVLDEELPDDPQLKQIITECHSNAKVKPPADDLMLKSIDAIRGLPVWMAGQITSMSLEKAGLNIDMLWRRWESQIEQTRGLKVSRFPYRFSDIGGLLSIKEMFARLFNGKSPPRLLILMDEIEKMLGGIGGAGGTGAADNTGVAQDQLGVLLTAMENYGWLGVLLLGVRGGGKSLIMQAAGNEFGVKTLTMDLGAMKGGIVGESETNIRTAVERLRAIGGQNVFFGATCNSIDVMPPALLRRFKMGIYFFDVPEEEEQDAIWPICLNRYGMPLDMKRPDNARLYTGSDIRNVCEIGWRFDCNLMEASERIVPVAVSGAKEIEMLRQKAVGNYLSASYKGTYQIKTEQQPRRAGRKIDLA